MRSIAITTGEIYHVCNRAIEGKRIFSNPNDCLYFLETAFLTNTLDIRQLDWRREQFHFQGIIPSEKEEQLVKIFAFVLMPDHFHLVAQQLIDRGIERFLHRLCNSYGRYFNIRHQRKGPIFIGPYKAIHLASDAQAAHIFTYVHANPLDLIERSWRAGDLSDWPRARQFLQNYQWSSLGVYANTKSHALFSEIISKGFSENYFADKTDHFDAIRDWGTRGEFDGVEGADLLLE